MISEICCCNVQIIAQFNLRWTGKKYCHYSYHVMVQNLKCNHLIAMMLAEIMQRMYVKTSIVAEEGILDNYADCLMCKGGNH